MTERQDHSRPAPPTDGAAPALPHRIPGSSDRRPGYDSSSRTPWDAFAVDSDVSATYGQPSPALIERARRGWRRLGSLHARIGEDGTQ
ncbi:hypothetical protein [Streptomyces sp. NPDC047718]|uniref:hypothetical protein n=1 Tax=Streptomyces sp. NPDC047718 TaxID=3155479 RepID=UPI0033D5614B